MIFIVLLILFLALFRANITANGYSVSYSTKSTLLGLKGVFVLLIFISHFVTYVSLTDPLFTFYAHLKSYLGQMVVVPFLFFSGYGVVETIRAKGSVYVQNMPVHRILKVLFQFDVAVLLFCILRWSQGVTYSIGHVLLTLIGWKGVGNSNWYIFAILWLYLFTWLAFSTFDKGNEEDEGKALAGLTVCSIGFIYVVWCLLGESGNYYYNTVIAYSAGGWFSRYRKSFEQEILSRNKVYCFTFFVLSAAFLIMHRHWGNLVVYEILSVLFAMILVMISGKIEITNSFLKYLGDHLFSLYILQRLPMMALQSTNIVTHPYLYGIICFGITLLLSYVFDRVVPALWLLLQKIGESIKFKKA